MADVPVLSEGGIEYPWVELKLDTHLANETDDIDRNIEYALAQEYVRFNEILETKSGAVSIVGSGPSLKDNWRQIDAVGGDIIACNAACQFLLERGVVPTYAMFFDADPLMLEFVTPHPEITYLVASRCPPSVFDMLKGCRVVCWHAAGDMHIREILEKHNRQEPMVGGGSAAVTRAMVLAHPIGYRAIHLFGCDSSFNGADTHIRKSTTEERSIHIMCNNRVFHTAPWMAQQAEDFKVLAPSMRDIGVTLVVHGDGLIPHLAKAMGFDVDGESRGFQLWRQAKQKTRILWSQL